MTRPGMEESRPHVWWVNQGRTFAHESRNGYFWAPLRNRRGVTPPHWRRMEEVRAGDVVLHYSAGAIRAVSRVQAPPERAAYPQVDHPEYGGRMGNLIYAEYHYLEPPVPRDSAARLRGLPRTEGPFLDSGAIQQGYLFRFQLEALLELVASFNTNWPEWLLDVLYEISDPVLSQHPTLRQFLRELKSLRVGTHRGQRLRYKPLMLLAAIRTVVEGNSIAFGTGPLRTYYTTFCRAIEVDDLHPEYPYFHLSGEGFWHIFTSQGTRFTSDNTPTQGTLRDTYVEFEAARRACIVDEELRPYVLGALRTYFNEDEWKRLSDIWPELTVAVVPELRPVLAPERRDLGAVAADFIQTLERNHLRFDASFVRAFVASLATKQFEILTGLSGSGKTQLALQFGNWFGPERVKLVAVRPDWTGADALFGYEDALQEPKDGRRAWHVPPALEFMLKAARDPEWPYLLILDEMNLAHVERYFADVLSGMESGAPCLPNVAREDDGVWRLIPGAPGEVSVPRNLFIVGTVNVDETTYMFSPKVLDRANTLEFRVRTEDLVDDARKPVLCAPGPAELVRGFLAIATDPDWHVNNPHPHKDQISRYLRDLHRILSQFGFEFGHRVFTESLRFAAMLAATGEPGVEAAVDAIVMQKVLPRLHGNRRRLEPVLEAVGYMAYYLQAPPTRTAGETFFDPLNPQAAEGLPRLPRSFAKVQRMTSNLRANQFASFAE